MIASEDIPIALIGMLGVVLAASIPAMFLWLGQRDIKNRLGVPNGDGPIAQMNEQQLSLQDEHTRLLSEFGEKLDAHLNDSKFRTAQFTEILTQGGERLVALETAHEEIIRRIDQRTSEITDVLALQDEAAAQVKADLESPPTAH